jgi:hypothetical protein
MFDFTTENILNDLSRVSVIAAGTDPGLALTDTALFVKRLNKFKASNTVAVYKAVGYSPVNEVAIVPVPSSGVAAGDVLRLSLSIVLSGGSQDGDYSRWAVFKGKPIYAEYLVTAAAAASQDALGAALVASLAPVIQRVGVNQVVLTYDATANNIVITAVNEYQRFKWDLVGATTSDPGPGLEKLVQTNADSSPNYDGLYTLLSAGSTSTPGKEGFGTSWFLTKNIRLPTLENLRFMGENQDEKPIEGALYNQYTIQYKAARNIGGQGVVGEKASSLTTHVLYVLATLATTFEGYLTTVFGSAFITNAEIENVFLSNASINGGNAVGDVIGRIEAPGANTPVYTLGGTDAASFTIAGDQLKAAAVYNHGTKATYAITITATDVNGEVLTKPFTISVPV